MNVEITPSSIAPPAARYAHGVVSIGPGRILHTSGTVGVAPDGTVPDDIGAQAELVWSNLGAILAEAGLGPRDIVSYTTYVVAGNDLARVMSARDAFLAGHLAASTLIPVPALARPEWKVEIAIVAAR